MRRWAFIIAVLGMFLLSLFLGFFEREVSKLNGLELNQRVVVSGVVVDERVISRGRVFTLDSGIEVVCDCFESFEGRRVSVLGVVGEFEGKKQVEVLKIVG